MVFHCILPFAFDGLGQKSQKYFPTIVVAAFREIREKILVFIRDVYQIRFSNTPFPIAALFDFREKLPIPINRKVFDILQ